MKQRISLILAMSLTVFTSNSPGDGFQNVLSQSRGSVASIEAISNGLPKMGTGFLFMDRDTLITNYHVIDGAQNVFALLPGEQTAIHCLLLDSRPDLDLAALHLKRTPKGIRTVIEVPDDIAFRPKPLDEILIVGHPGDAKNQTPLLGRFTAQNAPPNPGGLQIPVYKLQIPGAGGQSGAPVLNKTGRAIGVFYAGMGRGEFGINYAVPHANLLKLNLKAVPKPFAQSGNIPKISRSFDGTGVTLLSRNTNVVDPVGGKTYLGSRNWGFAPANTDTIYNSFVDDKLRFARFVPKHVLDQIIQQTPLLMVTNSAYGYRVLVPKGYQITEDKSPGYFSSYITYPNSNGGVRIVAHPIVPPRNLQELVTALQHNIHRFVARNLGKQIVPITQPFLFPNQVVIDPNPAFSDQKPRRNAQTGDYRLWQHYRTSVGQGFSHLVMYRIRDGQFLAVDITFPTVIIPKMSDPNFRIPDRFAYDMLIANSFADLL